MKKRLFVINFIFLLLILNFVNVNAYSPHYLPGGKNYISEENLVQNGSVIESINPILIKPYTEYTLSVDRDYAGEEFFSINVTYLNNDEYVLEYSGSAHNLGKEDTLIYDNEFQVWHLTFTTPANVNYLEFFFDDNREIQDGFYGIQLEEGIYPTAYEPYIEGTIIDTQSPYFIGAGTILSYFDQPITLSEIQSSLTAYDDIDGDLTANITIEEENYSNNMDVLGSYYVTFRVTDNSNNSTTTTINVEVVDVLPPIINGVPKVKAVYPNVYTAEEIKNMLTASDNYDNLTTTDIEIMTDNYTAFNNIIGEYSITFRLVDSSDNETIHVQPIEVVDESSPIFSGNINYQVSYSQKLSLEGIKSNLSVIDDYDESGLEIVLDSDNYSSNYNTIGNYEVIFSCTDSSGNKTTQLISINVVDEIGPLIYLDSSIIQTYTDTVLGLEDFVNLLNATKELDNTQPYFVTIRYDSYSKSANTPGNYNLYLDFEDGYGKIISKDFQIKVIEKSYDYIFVPQEQIIEQNSFFKRNSTLIIFSSSFIGAGGLVTGIYFLVKRKKLKLR
jgi:hypothetical protein